MTRTTGDLGRFGPFFELTELTEPPTGWTRVSELTTDRQLLGARVDAVRQALAGLAARDIEEIPLRVAASTAQLGVSARLLAPMLAATVDRVALGPLEDLFFLDRLGGPFPLGTIPDTERDTPPINLVAAVRPVLVAYTSAYSLSPRVAWGNVASALASAARMIYAVDPAAGRSAVACTGRLLQTQELGDAGRLTADGHFRRRSCCLIYRAASEPTFCEDCVLAR